MRRSSIVCGVAALAFAAAIAVPTAQTQPPADAALIKKAQAIHERVIALDTHDDINPANFTPERNYTQDLGNQVNLPKMVKGGLDASFFIVYVGQGPLTAGRLRRRLPAGGGEVRRDPPADREDRARQDRARADGRRRPAHQQGRQEGRAHRRRERLPLGEPRRRSSASRSSTTAARAISRWPTTATASSPTRTRAKRRRVAAQRPAAISASR